MQAYLCDSTQQQKFYLLDADRVAALLGQHDVAPPPEFVYANSFWNPRGREYGQAWILLSREDCEKLNTKKSTSGPDLDQLLIESLLTLVLDDTAVARDNTPSSKITVPNLLLVRAVNLLPWTPTTDETPYLVHLVDARYRCHNPHYSVPVYQQFNVTCTGKLIAPTEPNWPHGIWASTAGSGGDLWTWNEMVQYLWQQMENQLGDHNLVTLPFPPDGEPHDYSFQYVPAWLALCEVLDRLTCAVMFDPDNTTVPYSIVRVGIDTAGNETLARALASRGLLLHDDEAYESIRGRMPRRVTVPFIRKRLLGDTNTGVDANAQEMTECASEITDDIDTTGHSLEGETFGENLTGAEGLGHVLWDDLPFIMDAGSASAGVGNRAARATERRDDYERKQQQGGWIYKRFFGLWPFKTDGMLNGVAWRQLSGGPKAGCWMTEIVRSCHATVRPGARGQWESAPAYGSHSNARAPYLSPIPPGHPHLSVLVNSTDGAWRSGGFSLGTIQMRAPVSGDYYEQGDCYTVSFPPSGNNFLGRIIGNYDDSSNGVLPLVAINAFIAEKISTSSPGAGDNYINAGVGIPIKLADGTSATLYLACDAIVHV